MDIVRTNIERLNGQIPFQHAREGSEFIIQLPLTLATTKALMVMANDAVYAMPLVSVTEALGDSTPMCIGRRAADDAVAVKAAADRRPGKALEDSRPRGIGMADTSSRLAMAIARWPSWSTAVGEQDVVVKSLGDLIGNRKGLTGRDHSRRWHAGLIIDTASLVTEQAMAATA